MAAHPRRVASCPRGPASAAWRARFVPGVAQPRRDRGARPAPRALPRVPAVARPRRARRGALPRRGVSAPPDALPCLAPGALAGAALPSPPRRARPAPAAACPPRAAQHPRPRPAVLPGALPCPGRGGPASPAMARSRPGLGAPGSASLAPRPGAADRGGAALVRPWRGHGVAPAARPPRRAPPLPGAAAACRPGVPMARGLELGPACLWRAALSPASAQPRAVGLSMAPLSPAVRNAARARLGLGVCAARSRRVIAALRAHARMVHACFGTARRALGALVYPLDVPVYPLDVPVYPLVFHA
jgi:hypothetical protein